MLFNRLMAQYRLGGGVTRLAQEHLGELLVAAQNGDRAAYGRLLQDLIPLLRRFVGARMRGDVEDVVQDILISVHTARATYQPDRPFMPWLIAIARRRIVDHQRSANRARALPVAEYSLLRGGDSVPSQVEAEITVATAFRSWLPGLPHSQRVAVELLKLRGLSLREASEESGMSIMALKVAACRAMKMLRQELAIEQV